MSTSLRAQRVGHPARALASPTGPALAGLGRHQLAPAHRRAPHGVTHREHGHHSSMVAPGTSIRAINSPLVGPSSPATQASDTAGASAQDDSLPSPIDGLQGEADGPELQLASGIRISLRKVGEARVSVAELQHVLEGIKLLPQADQTLVAKAGVRIDLLPVSALEQGISGNAELGATDLDPDSAGALHPSLVRIAVRGADPTGAEAPGEIVQHELGHVVAVLSHGDRSENAATAYARAH